MSDNKYLQWLKMNKDITVKYYTKSIQKTYQQIFLEEKLLPMILPKGFEPDVIADVACGAGTLTYHISKIFPNAFYILSDINEDAINIAREINKNIKAEFLVEDFMKTKIKKSYCDIVFCMQTLLCVNDPRKFLTKIIQILKPGGYFIISSLFNTEHKVDIYCKVLDHTRKGNLKVNYNTFSKETIRKWIGDKVSFLDIVPFDMPVKIEKTVEGLGSYTLELKDGKFLTISGGLLLNWGFLYGKK